MPLSIIFLILVTHYFADFVFQDKDWAENKWKNNRVLVYHVLTYSGIFFFAMLFTHKSTYADLAYEFAAITFASHLLVDAFTSKKVHEMFEEKNYGTHIPNLGAFSAIGLDQLVHYAQLFVTYHFVYNV